MHLESPLFLLLLPFVWGAWKMVQSRSKKSIFSHEILEQLLVEKSVATKQPRFLLLALFFIILALCKPVLHVNKEGAVQTHSVSSLVIAIDISNSMLARDVLPTRLGFSKMAIEKIFEKFTHFRIALLAFSNDGFLVAPMSEDKASLNFLLKHLDPNAMSSEGSSIPSAIRSAKKIFTAGMSKDLLIISDGADGEKIEESIALARAEQIRVHLLLVGTTQGAMIYNAKGEALKDQKGNLVITKRADELKALALQTGGAYLISSGELSEIGWLSEQIALKASKSDVQTKESYTLKQLFYYPLTLSLVFLFLAFHGLHVKRLSALLLISFALTPAHSGILDWWEIAQAKNAYEKGDFAEATRLYEQVDIAKKSDASAYNFANALYQTKQYEKALTVYEGIKEKRLEQQILHNKGNTLAKLGRTDEAIHAYETALFLKEDDDTRFNLQLLQQQKEQKSKEQNQSQKPDNQEPPKDHPSHEQQQNEKNKEERTQDKDASPTASEHEEPKLMDEKEAKKWERALLENEPSTKPMKMYKSDKTEKNNAITW